MPRILIYSHDTFGLGNIRRMLAITEHLVTSHPEYEVLLLSGSPLPHAFRIPAGIDYIKLPVLSRSGETRKFSAKYLDLDYEETVQLRADIIVNTAIDFKPDLILVDKKPYGVGDELRAAIELLFRWCGAPKMVLLLRDILDTPEVTIEDWEKKGYHETIARHYDLVLVVGSPQIFDLRQEYQFPVNTAQRTRFCGYVEREPGRQTSEMIHKQLDIDDGRLVLVTVGGGEDGCETLCSYLTGLREHPLNKEVWSLVVMGPEMSETDRARVLNLASHCHKVLIKNFTDDMMSYINAADVVISMGGYNSVCEILTLKKRAIIIPRVTPVLEQWIRAERMAKLGLFRVIHPEQLTPRGLIDMVRTELSASGPPVDDDIYRAHLGGLDRVTECISSLLCQEKAAAENDQEQPQPLKLV